jgi:dolichol kinase/phosphoserine phosphatase
MGGLQKSGSGKLVVFDVEGVLIPRNRLYFDVAIRLGFFRLMYVLFLGFLYELGLLSIKSALTRIFWCMRGATVDLFSEKLSGLPVMPHAADVFAQLKAQGCKIALISSGFPTFLVQKLASKLGADYAYGVQIELNGEVLTGKIWGAVTQPQGKRLLLNQIMQEQHLTPKDCVVVADDRNNASLFLKDALKIGYNPDFIIRIKADAVVTGKLTNILPVINRQPRQRSWPSHKEWTRELIHSSGFFMPVFALLFGVPLVAAFILVVLVLYCGSEAARVKGKNIPIFSTITRLAASQSELCEFTFSPVFFAVGILLTLLLFPAPASYAAIAIFALGDSTASIVGGALAGRPLPFNRAKTVAGSFAGFFFAFLAGCVFISPLLALVGAAVGMVVEYLPWPINDNLLIPVLTGLAVTVLL